MRRHPKAATTPSPSTNPPLTGSALPPHYEPSIAGYARGPFLEPTSVTPTDWSWRGARTYIVRHNDGRDYRCLRVASEGDFVGYWAVELLGVPLPLSEWEE